MPIRKNARRTLDALREVGYGVSNIGVEEILGKKILLRQYVTEADIHPYVKGVTFKSVWARKVRSRIGATRVAFAGMNDLIKMKKAAARQKDINDLTILEKLKARKRKKKGRRRK